MLKILKTLSELLDHIVYYLFVILDFVITISAVITFIICLNLAVCPFLIYFLPDLLLNNLSTNGLCYISDNQVASNYASYSQNEDPGFSLGDATNIPTNGVSDPQGEPEDNNLHDTPVQAAQFSTGVKGFYNNMLNKTRRRFY